MTDRLTISIVTICFNCKKDLEKTLYSFESQLEHINPRTVEYVIVDGLSSDGTAELAQYQLASLKKKSIQTVLISEEDNGIYDAINKGVNHSHGEWMLILNAGDVLHDEYVLRDVLRELKKYSPDVLYGNTLRINPLFEEEWKPGEVENLRENMIFCHQSIFVRRNLREHYYNLKYKYCADYDLILRLYLHGKNFRYIDRYISNYSLDGVTANKGIVEAYKDIQKIRMDNGQINAEGLWNKIMLVMGICKRYIIKMLPVTIRWKLVLILHQKFHYKKSGGLII